jgi:hypothetical protein
MGERLLVATFFPPGSEGSWTRGGYSRGVSGKAVGRKAEQFAVK